MPRGEQHLARLCRVLGQRAPDCQRRLATPVVGTGLHLAAGEAGDWQALMFRVAAACNSKMDLEEKYSAASPAPAAETPVSLTSQWEHFLCGLAGATEAAPFRAELELQRVVCNHLREFEQAATSRPTIYRRLLHGHFADLISLNFDRTLALLADRSTKRSGAQRSSRSRTAKPAATPTRDPSLYRHYLAEVDASASTSGPASFSPSDAAAPTLTRIWHPHGDAAMTSSLKLGVRAYGRYLESVELAFRDFARNMRAFRAFVREEMDQAVGGPAARGLPEPELTPEQRIAISTEFHNSLRRLDDDPSAATNTTWVDIFLSAPLIFMGCGLSHEEWVLWWALHQRRRLFASGRTGAPPETLVLASAQDPALLHRLRGRPAGVEALVFDTWDDAWDTFFRALDQTR